MRERFGSRDEPCERAAAVLKDEDRKQPRAKLNLRGRCVLAGNREPTCAVIDASASAIALAVPDRGKIGERVVVYFDAIGRVEGEIIRLTNEGFVMRVTARSRASVALAELVERRHRELMSARPSTRE